MRISNQVSKQLPSLAQILKLRVAASKVPSTTRRAFATYARLTAKAVMRAAEAVL